MQAFDVVPLASGAIRLFFEAYEAQDPNKITRIYSLDSTDGYIGEDFNSGFEKTCGSSDGLQALSYDGACEPKILIGSQGDLKYGDSGLLQARQHKLGYPKLDSLVWDESDGTFMVITGKDACGKINDGLFYAIWNGSSGHRWEVEQSSPGCAAPLVHGGHGPVVVHLGGANYKLYYEDRIDETKFTGNKPFRIIYASGEDYVKFSDWESEENARDVNFLWPDGSLVGPSDESGFGDHAVLPVSQSLETQIMYLNIGGNDNKNWKGGSIGTGMAVFLNP